MNFRFWSNKIFLHKKIISNEILPLPNNLSEFAQFVSVGDFDVPLQMSIVEKMDAHLDKFRIAVESSKKKLDKLAVPKPPKYPTSVVRRYLVLESFYFKYCRKFLKMQAESCEYIINTAIQMYSYITTDPRLHINNIKFLNYLENKKKEDPAYMLLKDRRVAIKIKYKKYKLKIEKIVYNYKQQIKNSLIQAISDFDQTTSYSEPSEIDDIVANYLMASEMSHLIYPAAKMIACGQTSAAVMIIESFFVDFCKLLNITEDISRIIIYTSMVRFLFDQAYVIEPELFKHSKEDAIFLIKAEEFSNRSIRDMKLSSDIQRYYTPGLKIGALFNQKQIDMLRQLEFITNPIDLSKHIHGITLSLANFFGSETGVLSFDDEMTLILALTARAPPANTVSIVRFLERWKGITIDSIVSQSKNFFIAAVDQLMNEENM